MLQLETTRTFLRPINVEDAEVFYALNLDPDVVRYTGDGPFESVEHARAFLAVYDQYEKYGVGRFAVIEKATSKCIGWCGLKYHPEEEVYDLGYRFFKAYWNQGFASETATKWLEYGFQNLHLPRLVAHAMKANTASIRVLEKIGMHYLQDINLHGREAVLYEKKAEV